jgi:hypothetical protein
LNGSLLRRLLAAGGCGGAQGSEPAQLWTHQQQPLPLDSAACADFLVPDVRAPPEPDAAQQQQDPQPSNVEERQQQQQEDGPQQAPSALLGWRELRQRLLAAGASSAYASEAWARNHFRWVVWKLARAQLALQQAQAADGSDACLPQLLTAAVMLDELKRR